MSSVSVTAGRVRTSRSRQSVREWLTFVGLDNWVSVLTSNRFWQIALNTATFTLGSVGVPSPRWVVDVHWAMPAVIIVYVWKTTGYAAVIFLAGLQSIPKELYEAARVDGARRSTSSM